MRKIGWIYRDKNPIIIILIKENYINIAIISVDEQKLIIPFEPDFFFNRLIEDFYKLEII